MFRAHTTDKFKVKLVDCSRRSGTVMSNRTSDTHDRLRMGCGITDFDLGIPVGKIVYWIKGPLEVNKPVSRTRPCTTFTFADYHSGALKVVSAMSRYFTTLFQRSEVTKTCLRGPRCCISLFNKLISDSKLVSWHSPRFPGSYLSFRTYSRRVSRQGAPVPLTKK